MARSAKQTLPLELIRRESRTVQLVVDGYAQDVDALEIQKALAHVRNEHALHKSCGELTEALGISKRAMDRAAGLIHPVGRAMDVDFPLEMMLRDRFVRGGYVGMRYRCSHRLEQSPAYPERGTIQKIILIDGSRNALNVRVQDEERALDLVRRETLEPLFNVLPGYKRRAFRPGEPVSEGVHCLCDDREDASFAATLRMLETGAARERHYSVIVYAGHVVYTVEGAPHLVIGDRVLPVECLFALDARPRLIVLAGCGPESDTWMAEAPRRLLGGVGEEAPRAAAVLSAAYPVRMDAAVQFAARLLARMSGAGGRMPMDELVRRARCDVLHYVQDAERDALAFRYFGAHDYCPSMLHDARRRIMRWATAGAALAALALTAMLAGERLVRVGGARPAVTPAAFPQGAPLLATQQPAPSIVSTAFDANGALMVTTADCGGDIALGVFLQVEGDGSWYNKDAGITRDGDRFLVQWRGPGARDTQAKKLALFLYPRSEVRTTTAYALVAASSVDHLELVDLPQ